jgi:tRNA A-37 threonylcarbamoyl transferase component Bud32
MEGTEDLIRVDFAAKDVLRDVSENNVRINGFYTRGKDEYFVKVFKDGRWHESLKRMVLGHKAKKEFLASRYLTAKGIKTSEAVAVGIGTFPSTEAVIIFRVLSGVVPLGNALSGETGAGKNRYLDLLADFTASLHGASFNHRDYHTGNLLLEKKNKDKHDLFVIDLHRCSFPRNMDGRRGLMNLANVVYYLAPVIDERDVHAFLARYREKNPDARWEVDTAPERVFRRVRKIEQRRYKSRTKRCYKESTEFTSRKSWDFLVYFSREAADDLDEILHLIDESSRGGGTVIKKSKKTRVTLMRARRGEIAIKGYEHLSLRHRLGALMRSSRGHRSWWAARGLLVRGFDTPKPLALVIKRWFFIPRKIYVVTESTRPLLELDRYIAGMFSGGAIRDEKSRLVENLAETVGRLHKKGVYHGDMKAVNIVVRKERDAFRFFFLDLDNVRFSDRVSQRRRAKNLYQLYRSIPRAIDADDRRAFFRTYLEASQTVAEKDELVENIRERVRGRDIHYVTDEGDIHKDGDHLFRELFGT